MSISVLARRAVLAGLAALAAGLFPRSGVARDRDGVLDCPTRDCGWVYDPAIGDPEHGVAPGTPFEALPEDWNCPNCGRVKDLW